MLLWALNYMDRAMIYHKSIDSLHHFHNDTVETFQTFSFEQSEKAAWLMHCSGLNARFSVNLSVEYKQTDKYKHTIKYTRRPNNWNEMENTNTNTNTNLKHKHKLYQFNERMWKVKWFVTLTQLIWLESKKNSKNWHGNGDLLSIFLHANSASHRSALLP